MSDEKIGLSRKILNKTRMKFGVGNLLYNGDEAAFSPFHTIIVRMLGGTDAHLGFIGGAMQSMGPLFSWIGAVLLKIFRYNRKAMMFALAVGAIVQAVIVTLLVLASRNSAMATPFLYAYLGLITLMSMLTGMQQTISVSWIGDLVPVHQRGWFVSAMQIISNVGLILLQLIFAKLSTHATGFIACAGLMGLVFLNTVVAFFLFRTVPNCPSYAVNFLSGKKGDRIDYKYTPMWLLVWFQCAWSGGRVSLNAFSVAYMIDYFGFNLKKIILFQMTVNVVNLFMLYFMGRLSDRKGIRRPLMIISAACGMSMLLWVSSAWWGAWPLFLYFVINGAAGSTHWMLVNNLSLEAYPAKGRPNFLSFSRTVCGLFLMMASTAAGFAMGGIRGWSITLWGSEFNHYHIFFLGCTAVTITCLLPIWLLGKVKLPEPDGPGKETVTI